MSLPYQGRRPEVDGYHGGRSLVRNNMTWRWRRWINSDQQELWIARLQQLGCVTWTLTARPNRTRVLLEVYPKGRAGAVLLKKQFGGQMRSVNPSEWVQVRPTPPTRIGGKLEIVHDEAPSRKKPACPHLHIPHGLAFGSGEHSTTYLLLRALASHGGDWNNTVVLDLGTGSGVLALAARLFGARKIVATDFDSAAVRTARQNEALNFSTPLIRWRCADVKQLRATAKFDLVLANLFSGILVAAAPRITGSISPGGQLWISGVLRSQQDDVIAAYRGAGLNFIRAIYRGKWVMLILRAPAPQRDGQETTGGARKITQTK